VLSFTAAYYACVLGAFFFVKLERPSIASELAFWPSASVKILSVPYVRVKSEKKKGKKN
jgi:hypothetical protein